MRLKVWHRLDARPTVIKKPVLVRYPTNFIFDVFESCTLYRQVWSFDTRVLLCWSTYPFVKVKVQVNYNLEERILQSLSISFGIYLFEMVQQVQSFVDLSQGYPLLYVTNSHYLRHLVPRWVTRKTHPEPTSKSFSLGSSTRRSGRVGCRRTRNGFQNRCLRSLPLHVNLYLLTENSETPYSNAGGGPTQYRRFLTYRCYDHLRGPKRSNILGKTRQSTA